MRVRSSFLLSIGKIRSKWYPPKISSTSSVEGMPERVIAPPLPVARVIVRSRISVISGLNLINSSPELTSAGSRTSVPPFGVDGCSIISCSVQAVSARMMSALYKNFFFIVFLIIWLISTCPELSWMLTHNAGSTTGRLLRLLWRQQIFLCRSNIRS